MRRLKVIGIGIGDPQHLTLQAVAALAALDVAFVLDKRAETAELVRLREAICARHATRPGFRIVHAQDPPRAAGGEYQQDVAAWHAARAAVCTALLREHLPEGGCGAFLVWGDPALYDSTLRVLDLVAEGGAVRFELEVIPGLSSPQVLAARHRIALNRVGGAVRLTTGRRLRAGLEPVEGDMVVLLDAGGPLAPLLPPQTEIFWGAYLGGADEVLRAGRLAEIEPEIALLRAELRARKGWIMDCYLLRCPPAG